MLDTIYRQIYLERLTGKHRLHMVTMVDAVGSRLDGGDVVLEVADRKTGLTDELRCDFVLLGTGFEPKMPTIVRNLADLAGMQEIKVSRAYRMITPPSVTAACYLQGVNEESHGIADSLMSVIAVRAGEIVNDVLAHRNTPNVLASVARAA
jgi:L-ornithine N5-oxygenase